MPAMLEECLLLQHDWPSLDFMSMRLSYTLAFLVLVSSTAFAQGSNGYLFAGATKPHNSVFTRYQNSFAHIGGGGEAAVGRRIGLGGELGALIATDNRSRTVGLASIGPYFHFPTSNSRIDPFVTGGYSIVFQSGAGHLWHAGGGINFWMHRRVGFRAEFRDHVWLTGEGLQLLDFRFGIVLR